MHCLICYSLGGRSKNFDNRQQLDEHVLKHCGQVLDNTTTVEQVQIACFGISLGPIDLIRQINFSKHGENFRQSDKVAVDAVVVDDINAVVPIREDDAFNFCKNILNLRRSQNQLIKKSLLCNLCNGALTSANFLKFESVFDHALRHLKILMYSCKLCTFKAYTVQRITQHLRHKHLYLGSIKYFHNPTNEYSDQIKTIFAQCFDNSTTLQHKIPSKTAFQSLGKSRKLCKRIKSINRLHP